MAVRVAISAIAASPRDVGIGASSAEAFCSTLTRSGLSRSASGSGLDQRNSRKQAAGRASASSLEKPVSRVAVCAGRSMTGAAGRALVQLAFAKKSATLAVSAREAPSAPTGVVGRRWTGARSSRGAVDAACQDAPAKKAPPSSHRKSCCRAVPVRRRVPSAAPAARRARAGRPRTPRRRRCRRSSVRLVRVYGRCRRAVGRLAPRRRGRAGRIPGGGGEEAARVPTDEGGRDGRGGRAHRSGRFDRGEGRLGEGPGCALEHVPDLPLDRGPGRGRRSTGRRSRGSRLLELQRLTDVAERFGDHAELERSVSHCRLPVPRSPDRQSIRRLTTSSAVAPSLLQNSAASTSLESPIRNLQRSMPIA